MAATPTACGFTPAVPSLSPPITNPNKPFGFSDPFLLPRKFLPSASPGPPTADETLCGVAPKRAHVVLAVSGLMSSNSETDAELEPNNLNTSAGCQKYHMLADNLGFVVEYDLREDIDVDTNTDEV